MISGRGTNLQSLIDACTDPEFPAEIVQVISNRPNAIGINRAVQAKINVSVIDHEDFDDRVLFERELNSCLQKAGVELVCLAGFMRILSKWFVEKWHDRIINIHPSLLPSFKGTNVHSRVIESGVYLSGCTVHVVRTKVDTGPIILQSVVPVLSDDDEYTLASRVLKAEHYCYPCAVRMIANK